MGFNIIWASMRGTLTLLFANNKGADQPAHQGRLQLDKVTGYAPAMYACMRMCACVRMCPRIPFLCQYSDLHFFSRVVIFKKNIYIIRKTSK